MSVDVPAPGDHGGDGARLAASLGVSPDEVLDLSMSLNPYAPDVANLARRHVDALRRYPDSEEAHDALARAIGIDRGRLVLTNGGAEAIALVAAEWPNGDVADPEFSLYARHLETVAPGAPRWRSNPHNPTGRLAAPDETAAVWDEAFYPLATGCWTRGDDAIVVGSLTKVFACPGLRIGYVVTPDADTASCVGRRQSEWALNSLACAVLPDLLAQCDVAACAAAIRVARAALVAALEACGLEPDPSDANFVLVRRAPELRTHLARRGVLVRDTASFGIPGGVRVAVPGPTNLDRLASALEDY